MIALGYSKWGNFKKVIDKAKITCETSNNSTEEHFADTGKVLTVGNNAKMDINDYKLSRYACYLIVQNADPRKKTVALGQTYFAYQTRKMEITEQQYSKLSEDEKRLYTRLNIKNKNKYLFDTAKKSGVTNYAKFNDYGYKGLYNGETSKAIAKRKGINPDKEEILDYMGSTELAANLFRITQTDEVLKNNNVKTEQLACATHHMVGKAVRENIKKVGGTMTEDLPPQKKINKRNRKRRINKIKIERG